MLLPSLGHGPATRLRGLLVALCLQGILSGSIFLGANEAFLQGECRPTLYRRKRGS